MKVLKFGGTSVGSIDAIKRVAEIVTRSSQSSQLIVVVSAIGGVTNQLVELGARASRRDKSYEELLDKLESQHVEIHNALGGNGSDDSINKTFSQLREVCKGVFLLKELTPRTNDYIQSCGERLSAYIIGQYFRQAGIESNTFDSRDYIITDKQFGNASIIRPKTKSALKDINGQMTKVNLFPGFVASTEDRETSTLGRGGSDFTASLLANVFEASALEIWTDVNGLMTADPRLVKNAHLLEHVSYEEALELSHFGAKVLYPPSIQPALERGIPISVRNTFNPEGPSTQVTRIWKEERLICGISSIQDIAMLNLTGSGMVGVPKFSYRFFKSLSEVQINVILITQASSEHSICICVSSADGATAADVVRTEFKEEIELGKIDPVKLETDLSIVAVVGSNMRDQVGVSGKMFNTLGRNGINVKAIAQGSSERNISAVIPKNDLKKALNTLHESFFLSEMKRVNLFVVGVGNVGEAFLNQVQRQQKMLAREFRADIRVVAIANSRKCYFDPNGIALGDWRSRLEDGDAYSVEAFLNKLSDLNLRNSVFIDITASTEISEVYQSLLESSVSIVTPNKIAATREMEKYLDLKRATKRFGSQFLFETNVAAGLPVISTLNDLFKSGDRVISIQAVLSGTLNYLFNEYNGSRPFVEVVKEAKALGLTEPDPRLDLSGEDVMRKLLILIRESGKKFEMDQVEKDSFLPESCEDTDSLEAFYQSLERYEDHFKSIYQEAEKRDSRLRVVASYADGRASVGLQSVKKNHPFYYLEGKDNIVLFYTERYREQPLVIKGAGAGAEVTASGIFADVLRLVNSN